MTDVLIFKKKKVIRTQACTDTEERPYANQGERLQNKLHLPIP